MNFQSLFNISLDNCINCPLCLKPLERNNGKFGFLTFICINGELPIYGNPACQIEFGIMFNMMHAKYKYKDKLFVLIINPSYTALYSYNELHNNYSQLKLRIPSHELFTTGIIPMLANYNDIISIHKRAVNYILFQ